MCKVTNVLISTLSLPLLLSPAHSSQTTPTCSTHPNQIVPDPAGDCSVFYQCSGEVAHQFVCPAGLVFNPDKSLCDWPGTDTTSCSSSPPTNRSPTTVNSKLVKIIICFCQILVNKETCRNVQLYHCTCELCVRVQQIVTKI